jgi:hypothetical protein
MRFAVCVLCAWGCALCLTGLFPVGIEAQALSGTQHYVVQYGDTLWDIAGTYLGNPYRWRDIHQQNPFITNPNLIYPGDILGISDSGLSDGAADAADEAHVAPDAGVQRSAKQISRPWYGVPAPEPKALPSPSYPSPVVPSTEFIEAIGYIIPYSLRDLQAADFGQITGAGEPGAGATARVVDSESGRPGLLFGDIVYINKGFEDHVREGDVYIAFRPFREIRHPVTNELLGTHIDILGRIRVRALESGISAAEITKSYNYIAHGDPIIPASEVSLPLQRSLLGNAQSYGFRVGNQLIAHIIAERVGQNLMGDGSIVFLDVGAAQGVQPADNFIIFREVGDGYPKQSIGRLTVLSVQEQTSTALITYSVKAIELGEQAVLMR